MTRPPFPATMFLPMVHDHHIGWTVWGDWQDTLSDAADQLVDDADRDQPVAVLRIDFDVEGQRPEGPARDVTAEAVADMATRGVPAWDENGMPVPDDEDDDPDWRQEAAEDMRAWSA